MNGASSSSRKQSLSGGRAAAVYVVYFLLHAGFDASARLFEVSPGVSIWYPPAGLALALATIAGLRCAPVVLAAQLYSGFVTSMSPASWSQAALPVLITMVYVGTGSLARRWFGAVPKPTRPLEMAGLIGLYLAAPLLAATLGSALVVAAKHIAVAELPRVAFGWWIGDLTGVLTVVPIALVHIAPRLFPGARPEVRRTWSSRDRWEVVGQGVTLFAFLAIVHGFGYLHPHQTYYLCFVPLVWICLRHGLPGATIAVLALTMGTLLSLQLSRASTVIVTDLLLFEIAVATIGLGLGATVTRRARAESDRSRLLAILEATPDFIATADLQGRVLYQNAALLRLHGETSLHQARERFMNESHPSWAAEKVTREGIPAALAHGLWQAETAFLDAHGREVPVSQLIVAHYDENRRPVMLSTVARDITAQKQAERARLESERNLLQAQKLESLGVLAGGIAHDFNNLLTVMLGNATLARLDVPPDSATEKAIHQIELAALRAAELCRQMLAYSGKGRLASELIDLTKLVEDTTHLLKVSISKKCRLELDLARSLPPVKGDATQLNQITMNLVMNASDASAEQGGAIRIRTGLMRADRAYLAGTYLSPDLEPGPYVYLEVSDEGCGMSPEVLAHMFEPFFTTKFSGHGLGLSAVLGIARSHLGAVKVDSIPNRGTTFRLLLPASTGAAPAAIDARDTPAATRDAGRVLVVDDEDSVREIASRILERFGYTAVAAHNGREGLDLFQREPHAYRAVLLDLTMPVMDGEEAFREIHRLNPAVPVVLMSGYNKTDSSERFAGRGLAGFVQKPFEATGLIETLRTALARAQPGRS
ncbi:MAG TPA: response regulator [Opitutus sp.]|nr:response regulator [Opitutus sp.]